MSSSLKNVDLCVARGGPAGLSKPVLVESTIDVTRIPPNHILLKVDKFGFSANNITYGLLGESQHFKYFDFYPAPTTPTTSASTHGIIPVWGFGTVIMSTHPTVKPGQRLYGYLGMSRYLVLPIDPQTNKFSLNIALGNFPADRRPYKQLTICDTDPVYRADKEDETMLYRPLFWTSFWFEDYLYQNQFRDVNTILISSASAKTAFCLAYLIQKRKQHSPTFSKLAVIGLTSESNLAFTKKLGLYDAVHAYGTLPALPVTGSYIYVDVAGNPSLNTQIARHVNPLLTVSLGKTNVDEGSPDDLQGGKAGNGSHEFFFMPEWLAVRRKQLSVEQIKNMQGIAWNALMEDCQSWVGLRQSHGASEVLQTYERTLKGKVGPSEGLVLSLWDREERPKL